MSIIDRFKTAEKPEDYTEALSMILGSALVRTPEGKALSLSFCDAANPPWALQAIALSALPQDFRDTARAILAAGRVPVLVSICAGVDHACEARMVGARRPT